MAIPIDTYHFSRKEYRLQAFTTIVSTEISGRFHNEVMMHEFIVGPLPFGRDTDDQLQLLKEIMEVGSRLVWCVKICKKPALRNRFDC